MEEREEGRCGREGVSVVDAVLMPVVDAVAGVFDGSCVDGGVRDVGRAEERRGRLIWIWYVLVEKGDTYQNLRRHRHAPTAWEVKVGPWSKARVGRRWKGHTRAQERWFKQCYDGAESMGRREARRDVAVAVWI